MNVIGHRFAVDQSWGPYKGDMSKVVRAADMQNGLARVAVKIFENGGAKLDHGSGGEVLLRAA
jgi:hypothetical protein